MKLRSLYFSNSWSVAGKSFRELLLKGNHVVKHLLNLEIHI